MHVPFVDLRAQYQSIKSEVDAAIQQTIAETAFIGGKELRAFEAEFATYCGVSGWSGLQRRRLWLRALRLRSVERRAGQQ